MDDWAERGRPVVREALNHALEVIDRELQAENRKLRAQLAAISSSASTTCSATPVEDEASASKDVPASSIAPAQPIPASSATKTPPPTSTGSENAELIKSKLRFNALADNFKKAKEALRKRKDERDLWKERAKTLESQVRAFEEKHGMRVLEQQEDDRPEASHATRPVSDMPPPGVEPTLPPILPETLDREHVGSIVDPLLQSTQGDSDESETEELPLLPTDDRDQGAPVIKSEPSSDVPVVVSEKILKRRRVEEDGPAVAAYSRIKAESTSSSPITASEHYHFDIHESIDLDDIAQRITTPRKRKDLEALAAADGSARTALKLDYARLDTLQQPAGCLQGPSVLTPISGNKRMTGWTADEKKGPPKATLARGIATLAEDGAFYGKERLNRALEAMQTPTSMAKGRLNTLLNTSTPDNAATISRTPQARHSERTSGEHTPLDLLFPEPRELPFEKMMRQTKKRRVSTAGLRHKPLSELRLDDFKVNPLANEGQDFAFSEVVRDKNERAALRGCTDMHCCGKHFRALALSQRPDPPLTAAQRQEEQKLLEEYLGDDAWRLASMAKDERDELWVKAKTEELANKYGRHRHRFSRMQSPPGFWNADFPNTQELAADKEEALKREKRAIAERHREAMRPGGMWLFRDE
ncbi:SAE2-domain-containing protein [Trichoderma citrinoviride]|uniref:SAE2-domain-containing protein n=1 Tax=Trichoderma citrinoviride TaxID=58853 RepID=A0A2T4BGX7_9HYPO|nr:SAE2-domain-containing protein [Trichoderma citrinoviride]PTB68574.1 SAE2-domain-containing protein [Trichoderma citrinoviride]